jgi:hypothetical protein
VLKLLRTPFDWFLRPLASFPRSRPSAEPGPGPALTPETAACLAAVAVHLARVHQVELDCSPASLDQVEALILGLRSDATAHESLPRTLLVFGCYVGEVRVRHLDFSWDVASPAERGLRGATFGLRAQRRVMASDWPIAPAGHR